MKKLILPAQVNCGIDSFQKIFDIDYNNIIVISDGNISQRSGVLLKIKRVLESRGARVDVLTGESEDFFSFALKESENFKAEAVIGVGNAKSIDIATAVASTMEVDFIALPECAYSGFTEIDTLDCFLYTSSPEMVILDPMLITQTDSGRIAYEGMGCLCSAVECAIESNDSVIKSLALNSAEIIYKNLMPSYKGEISARENLLKGMYMSFVCFLNCFEHCWSSLSYRAGSFFSKWGVPPLSTMGIMLPEFACKLYEEKRDEFQELADCLISSPLKDMKPIYLIDSLRRNQAIMQMPSCIKNTGISENDFHGSLSDISESDREFFEKCYYGSVRFIKK